MRFFKNVHIIIAMQCQSNAKAMQMQNNAWLGRSVLHSLRRQSPGPHVQRSSRPALLFFLFTSCQGVAGFTAEPSDFPLPFFLFPHTPLHVTLLRSHTNPSRHRYMRHLPVPTLIPADMVTCSTSPSPPKSTESPWPSCSCCISGDELPVLED